MTATTIPIWEGYKVRDLVKKFAMPVRFRENIDLIAELQAIHDIGAHWVSDRMETTVEIFSKDRGLTMCDETVVR